MTRLRVLSGRHAGVSIDWEPDRLIVGANEEFDAFIGDWNAQQIELRRHAEGHVQAHWNAAEGKLGVPGERRAGDEWVCDLAPWVPVRFGSIILCIGPSDADWPDDAELLSRCFAPPEPAAARGVGHRRPAPLGRRIMIVAAVTGMLAATPSSVPKSVPKSVPSSLHHDDSTLADAVTDVHAKPAGPAAATGGADAASAASAALAASAASANATMAPQRLQALIEAQGLQGLEVTDHEDRLVVTGVLSTRAAVDRLNRLLDGQPHTVVIGRRFIAAPDLVDRLYGIMPERGLTVRQTTTREFLVTGRVDDPSRASAVIAQVAADLAEFGARVELALESRHDPLPSMSGLLIDGQGMSILRTRDGVKHIVVTGRPVALAAPTPGAPPAFTAAPPAQEQRHDPR